MKLQELLFPTTAICDRNLMYYRLSERAELAIDEHRCRLPEGESLTTSTYFNGFSIGKWRRYTALDNLSLTLQLTGSFRLQIVHAQRSEGKNIIHVIVEKRLRADRAGEVTVSIPVRENIGIYYFRLWSQQEDSEFLGGYYATDVEEALLPPVHIAIGICTYHREDYIAHNLTLFRELLTKEDGPLCGHLDVFISDNGQTLPDTLNSEHIHLFPNKNLGGSGGFARCMIEIMKVRQEQGITHLLLMDDDVQIEPHSFELLCQFLRLLRKEHRDAFVSGSMLRIDKKYIQQEAGDHWNLYVHNPVKYNYNLENFDFVLKNEIEDTVNCAGWWFCCMPAEVVQRDNLPLPLFIKRDDIEYGLRNGTEFISLNGVCLWHESFQSKWNAYLEYYYFRNTCIINSRHRVSYTEDKLIQVLQSTIVKDLKRFQYLEAEFALLGVLDYLKGIDWLKAQDGEKLNRAIMGLSYQKQPVEDIDYNFIHGEYERHLGYKESKRKKLKRKLTLNGWLVPLKLMRKSPKNVVVPAYNPHEGYFFGAKKVLFYEESSGKAYVSEKNYRKSYAILKLFFATKKRIRKDYKRVTEEYRRRYDELTRLDFWEGYLSGDGDVDHYASILSEKNLRPRSTKAQCKRLIKAQACRLLQGILYFLPTRRNRVMIYVHDRKGLTCNPKYMVLKLHELYGDRMEIIWVSRYPDTCDELRRMGIRVVKTDSKEHVKAYLRTRVYVTNDSFPAWAAHRHGQLWINLWHAGMNYKHIGYDYIMKKSRCGEKLYRLENRQPNHYISGSRFFTEDTSRSFRLDPGVFLPYGMARNDLLFQDRPEIAKKVRTKYKIGADTRIVMYAPTFRAGFKSDTYGLDFDQLLDALTERFGGEWVLFFRNHNFVKSKKRFAYVRGVDVSAYPDMQELLYVSDVLVSDYSSCLWDFALTRRPAFVYAPDMDHYVQAERAFSYPVEKWPYPIVRSNMEFKDAILSFDEESYRIAIEEHLKDGGSYDDGNASQKVAELIGKYCLRE